MGSNCRLTLGDNGAYDIIVGVMISLPTSDIIVFGMHLPEFTAVGMLGFAMRSGASRATPKDAEYSQVRSQNLRAASKRSTQQDRQGVSMRVQSPGHTPQARVKSPNTYQPQ